MRNSHMLDEVFAAALEQVTSGKGEERHGNGQGFIDQPWRRIADTHGTGFLTGQAAKKLEEAQRFSEHERWEREMLGAMVYIAMAILHTRLKADTK